MSKAGCYWYPLPFGESFCVLTFSLWHWWNLLCLEVASAVHRYGRGLLIPSKQELHFLGEWHLPGFRSHLSSMWKGKGLWQHPSNRRATSVMWRLSVRIDKKMNFPEKLFGFPMIEDLRAQSLLAFTDKMSARVAEASLSPSIVKVKDFLPRMAPEERTWLYPLSKTHLWFGMMFWRASTQIAILQVWLLLLTDSPKEPWDGSSQVSSAAQCCQLAGAQSCLLCSGAGEHSKQLLGAAGVTKWPL